MSARAFSGAAIFDGTRLCKGKVLVTGQGVCDLVPQGMPHKILNGGTILPGFVDLQVNGGGGVMFNDAPDVDTLRVMARAHATLGTAALLPTLITDTPATTRAAIDAVRAAIVQGVPGIAGLHLEGPHLAVARKGAHDAALIRPMDEDDLMLLCNAARDLPNLMVTLAPETVTTDQISALTQAGVLVSLGHSDCDFDTARRAMDAGARLVTHLFNAMSGLGHRTPGLVGAALSDPRVMCGLIADGVHVHCAAMQVALAARPEGMFLVTDAMAPAGTDQTGFTLGNRRVLRRDGRLTLEDGTLAGADLAFGQALAQVRSAGVSFETALAMATTRPAAVLRNPMGAGTLERALWMSQAGDMYWLDDTDDTSGLFIAR